jgi:hypothetical protein
VVQNAFLVVLRAGYFFGQPLPKTPAETSVVGKANEAFIINKIFFFL